MKMILRMRVSALLAFGLAGACRSDAPAPAPEPTPASGDRLRPMTSREGSPPGSFAPAPGATLPAGHPPVGGEGSGSARPGGAPGGPPVGPVLSGNIRLAPTLKGRHAATDSLFVIVRSAKTGEILAVRKEQATSFPFAFQISGADSMTGQTEFAGPFDVTARLSKTGEAMPGPGDVEGKVKGVDGAKAISITLDTVRP